MASNNSSSSNSQPQRVSMSLQDESTVKGVAIIVLTFLAPVPKECRCSMCEHLMRDPCHVSCCGARYCQKCVDRLIAAKHRCMNRRCQRKGFRKELSREDKGLANIIAALQVYCPMKPHGCQWTGRIRDLEAHLRWGEYDSNETHNCRFLPVPCPTECGESVPRRQMEEHLQVTCDKRSVKCQFCPYKDVAAVVETIHQPSCPLRVVECPSGCGMPGIKQSGLPHHQKEECPLRLVLCEHMGCEERYCLKDRDQHNKQRFHEHFQLMSERVVALSHENEELRSLALSVQDTCSKLQEQYGTLVDILIRREREEEEDGDYLSMTGLFPIVSTPPPLPTRDDRPDDPPTVYSRTDSMRKTALASFSKNSGSDLPNSDSTQTPSSEQLLRQKMFRRPVSIVPPRFSTLIPPSLASSSSCSSSPDFAHVGTWNGNGNILPLPPRSSRVFEMPPSPLVGPPATEHQVDSSPPEKLFTNSPASYEHPVGAEHMNAVPSPQLSSGISTLPSSHSRLTSPPPLPPHPTWSTPPPPTWSTPPPPVPPSPILSPPSSTKLNGGLAPPPPPRRDSLSSSSFLNPDRRVSESQHSAQPTFHISMPNLLQGDQGFHQHRSRTWSTASSMHPVDNPVYSRNNSISQRYETSSCCDRVSISSDLTVGSSSDCDSQFTDSLDGTLKAGDLVSSILPRQCRSVDMEDSLLGRARNKIQMSRSTETLNFRQNGSCTYVNVGGTFAKVRAASMNVNSNVDSFGKHKGGAGDPPHSTGRSENVLEEDDAEFDVASTNDNKNECVHEEDNFHIDSNPVYIRSPAVSLSHGSDVSHHTLVISGPKQSVLCNPI